MGQHEHPGSTSAAELRELFEAWLAAIASRDTALIAGLLDPSWVYVDFTGHLHDRTDYLRIIGELVGTGHSTELVEFDAHHVTSDVAVAHGRYTSVGTMTNGFRAVQDSRFTGTWRRDTEGRWWCCSHQATNVGTPFE